MLSTQLLILQDLQDNLSMDDRCEFIPVVKLVRAINIIAGFKKAMEAFVAVAVLAVEIKKGQSFLAAGAYNEREGFSSGERC